MNCRFSERRGFEESEATTRGCETKPQETIPSSFHMDSITEKSLALLHWLTMALTFWGRCSCLKTSLQVTEVGPTPSNALWSQLLVGVSMWPSSAPVSEDEVLVLYCRDWCWFSLWAPGYLINFLLLCGIGVSGLYRLRIGFPGFSTFPGLGVEVWMGFTFLTAGVRDWSHCCSVLLQHPKEYSLRGSSLCFPLGYPRAWSTDLAWFTRFVGHTRSLRFIAEAFSHFILGIPFQARPKAHELCIHHCDETS